MTARTLALSALFCIGCGGAPTFEQPIHAPDGVALDGYDAVAYHTLGAPTLGDPAISAEWGGAAWHFASAEHRTAFVADPERYAPAHGGHCAFAASLGLEAPGSPEHWVVADGRLYLNKNGTAAWLFSPPAVDVGPPRLR